MLDPFFAEVLNRTQANWRVAVSAAIEYGVAVPAFGSALSYYDSYRSANLPANLLQSQRDYFGAHTFERVDKPAGQFNHALADFIAPRSTGLNDYLGAFAVTAGHGTDELAKQFEKDHGYRPFGSKVRQASMSKSTNGELWQ